MTRLCEECRRRLSTRRDLYADLAYHAERLALLLHEDGNKPAVALAVQIADVAIRAAGGRGRAH